MTKGFQSKMAIGLASMALGCASILYAESFGASSVPANAASFATREEIAAMLSLPVDPQSNLATELPVSVQPAAHQAALDQRLIADLLVESIVQIESQGNSRMVGSKGERGLMQIKAATWNEVAGRHFGGRISFNRAFEGDINRRVGSAYLSDLQTYLQRYRASWKADERSLLLACFNAGPDRVRQCGFDIRRLPASTRDYIARGSALHDSFLADHNIPAHHVRVAMDATRRAGGV